MVADKLKIMWLSDSPLSTTGFARISIEVLNGLAKKGWECTYVGHNLITQPIAKGLTFEDGCKHDFKILGTDGVDFGKNVIVDYINTEKPDVFGILLDTFMVAPWLPNYEFSPAHTVFYYPSDGGQPSKFGRLPLNCESVLKKMKNNVAMAKFGQKQVQEAHNLQTHYIPHAVDHKLIHPYTKKKRKAVRQKYGLDDYFIIGTVARNQPRKMLDKTIEMFSLIAPKYPNARLFMHCDPTDVASYFNMSELIARYNLENRVIFTGTKYFKGLSWNSMNEIYNCMDVFLLTTTGEGFGVPLIEAMAAKVPVLATNYTTTPEIVLDNNAGLAIELSTEIMGSWNVYRAVPDVKDGAKKLSLLIDNKQLRERLGNNGRAAVLKYYTWDVVIEQWHEYLTNLVKR